MRYKSVLKTFGTVSNPQLTDKDFPDGWTNFYRQDDVSATEYFIWQLRPSQVPSLQDSKIRRIT